MTSADYADYTDKQREAGLVSAREYCLVQALNLCNLRNLRIVL